MLSEYEVYAIAGALWWLVGFVTVVWRKAIAQSRISVADLGWASLAAVGGAMIPICLLIDRLEHSGVLEMTVWRRKEGDKE
ncbi:hypothetical protein [Ralstonia pseudosolanacearum]|uniref:hypothetical protein n=1 Tax=Ralstonia pseudosolanacearum TaxID=1310165 RepID=UPI00048A7AC6|nr:hypothetical protein [Ralstonia pseudosolanacearum]